MVLDSVQHVRHLFFRQGRKLSTVLMRVCFNLKLGRVQCSVNIQAGAEGTVALHPQLATPVCRCVFSSGQIILMVFPCSPCRSKAVELEVVEGEAVCRWCSNPGVDGLSCSKCESHFCRKVFHLCLRCWCDLFLQCLNVNLGAGFIKLASASEGDWTCLLCKSAPLEKLRTNLLAPLQVNHSGL